MLAVASLERISCYYAHPDSKYERLFLEKSRAKVCRFNYIYRKSVLFAGDAGHTRADGTKNFVGNGSRPARMIVRRHALAMLLVPVLFP